MGYEQKHERVQLQNAPIVETSFDVRGDGCVPYAFVPGILRKSLRDWHDDWEVEERNGFLGGVGAATGHVVSEPIHRFIQKGGAGGEAQRRMILSGPGLLALSMHGNYSEWSEFRDPAARTIEAFLAVFEPESLTRLGLRYVNFIPVEDIEGIDAPLRVSYQIPDLFKPVVTARSRFDCLSGNDRLSLVVQFPHVRSEKEIGIGLDLDVFCPEPPQKLEAVLEWLESAHAKVYDYFREVVANELLDRYK